MKDYKPLIDDALDLYRYDTNVLDSLEEMRRKWGEKEAFLSDSSLEELVVPYLPFDHEKGLLALSQELGHHGIAVYDLSGEDIFLLVAIRTKEMEDFEAWCRESGQFFKLLKQRGKEYGEVARREKAIESIPLEEHLLDDDEKYYIIQKIAGFYAHAICYEKKSEQKLYHVFIDLKKHPLEIIEVKDKDNLGNFSYMEKQDLYLATFTQKKGFLRTLGIGRDPRELSSWETPASPGFDPSVRITFHDDTICITDKWHVTLLEHDGSSWKETNILVDSNSQIYKAGFDGKSRLFFTNQNSNSILFAYKNKKVGRHSLKMKGSDDISNSIPVPKSSEILLSRFESAGILKLNMDSGRCHLLPLKKMEWNSKITPLKGPWVLIKGNGEDLRLDFAKLWNLETGEILRMRPGTLKEDSLQEIAALPDGRYAISYRSRIGQKIGFTKDLFEFLRKNTRAEKAVWLPYYTRYPDIPSGLPEFKREESIILKKDGLILLGMEVGLPLRYEELSSILGRSRILENESRLSVVWEDWGIEGFLSEDEERIERLVIALGPSKRHHIEEVFFCLPFLIGDTDYRDVRYKVSYNVLDTLDYGSFRIQTSLFRNPEELSNEEKGLHEILSNAIEISLVKETGKAVQAAKKKIDESKYEIKKIKEESLFFKSFNFKLAVIEVLMYEKKLLSPILDAYEFASLYKKRKIDIEEEGYHVIQEIKLYFKKLEIPKRLAKEVEEIDTQGSEIYNQVFPFWDGEDDTFAIDEIDREELLQFENLKKMEIRTTKPKKVVPILEELGIEVELF